MIAVLETKQHVFLMSWKKYFHCGAIWACIYIVYTWWKTKRIGVIVNIGPFSENPINNDSKAVNLIKLYTKQ